MGILKFEIGDTLRMIAAYVQAEEHCKLVLVHDDGIYLCPVPVPSAAFVLYADGCNPADEDDDMTVYDRCRDLVGGDDFVDKVPLDWVVTAIERDWQNLCLQVTEKQVILVDEHGDIPDIFSM